MIPPSFHRPGHSGHPPESQNGAPLALHLGGPEAGETHGQAPRGAGQPQAVRPRGQHPEPGELRRRPLLLGGGGRRQGGVDRRRGPAVHQPEGEVHRVPGQRLLDAEPAARRPVRRQQPAGHAGGRGGEAQEGGGVFGLRRGPRVLLLRGGRGSHIHLQGQLHGQTPPLLQSRSAARRGRNSAPLIITSSCCSIWTSY